ncbi:hypothetical protein FHG87_002704 [Trinorchestia longiramus]|nr:hypothetical protein FHG87_002704 [Trinorchestia longiramus]
MFLVTVPVHLVTCGRAWFVDWHHQLGRLAPSAWLTGTINLVDWCHQLGRLVSELACDARRPGFEVRSRSADAAVACLVPLSDQRQYEGGGGGGGGGGGRGGEGGGRGGGGGGGEGGGGRGGGGGGVASHGTKEKEILRLGASEAKYELPPTQEVLQRPQTTREELKDDLMASGIEASKHKISTISAVKVCAPAPIIGHLFSRNVTSRPG